jgi:hypothetical protein
MYLFARNIRLSTSASHADLEQSSGDSWLWAPGRLVALYVDNVVTTGRHIGPTVQTTNGAR